MTPSPDPAAAGAAGGSGPLAFFRSWAQTNPAGAAVLSGAIACFAAVAIIASFGIDLQASIPSVTFVLAIGLAFYAVLAVVDQPVARRTMGYFVLGLAVLWGAFFFWSKAHPRDPVAQCVVYFWQPCVVTADDLSAQTAAKPAVQTPTTNGPAGVDKGKYRVFIQFAGFARPTVVDLAQALAGQGWNVQGASQGGERLASAAGLAEVRYRDAAAAPAAQALAAALSASKVSSRPIRATQLEVVAPGALEVWIGQ